MLVNELNNSEVVDTVRDALLVLDEDLTVRFANASFYATFETSPQETLGYKVFELGNGQWNIAGLTDRLKQILPEETTIESFDVEHEFEDLGRRVMRLNARKTVRPGNGSTRLLLAINDVTRAADLDAELDRQRRLAQGIVDTIREPLLILDGDLRVIAASRSFYTFFHAREDDTVGQSLQTLGNGQWNIPSLVDLLENVIPHAEVVEDFEVDHEFPEIGRRQILLNARKVYREGNNSKALLLAMEDITVWRVYENEREQALENTRLLLEELNHRVMNSLSMIGAIIAMESRDLSDEECRDAFARMRGRVAAVGDLYKALTGANSVDTVSAQEYLGTIAEDVVKAVGDNGDTRIALHMHILPAALDTGTAVCLGLVVNELVTNSIKYGFKERDHGEIHVALEGDAEFHKLTVTDDGRGIDTSAHVASGIGSRLVDAFVKQLNGRTHRRSGVNGTEVAVTFRLDESA